MKHTKQCEIKQIREDKSKKMAFVGEGNRTN